MTIAALGMLAVLHVHVKGQSILITIIPHSLQGLTNTCRLAYVLCFYTPLYFD